MKDFKKGGFGGSRGGGGERPRRDFDSRPSFGRGGGDFNRGGDRDRRPEMHKATCANCGKSCEVPFRPNGEKPVYCQDCFRTMQDGGAPQKFERNDAPRRDFGNRDEGFKKPSFAAPAEDKRIDNLVRQLDQANSKLDRLMDMVRAAGRGEMQQKAPKEESAKEAAPAFSKSEKTAVPAKKEVAKPAKKAAPAKKPAAKKKK